MLERVWQRNLKLFERLIRNILFDHSLVEDVLQEAFARVLQSGRHFSSETEAFNYLRRTVVNTTIDYYRRQIRRRESCDSASQPVTRTTPLELMILEEEEGFRVRLLEEVRQALRLLPPEQRQAIELMFQQREGKMKDVCREAGIPYSTLRSRMLSGLDAIRRQLRRRGLLPALEEARR